MHEDKNIKGSNTSEPLLSEPILHQPNLLNITRNMFATKTMKKVLKLKTALLFKFEYEMNQL